MKLVTTLIMIILFIHVSFGQSFLKDEVNSDVTRMIVGELVNVRSFSDKTVFCYILSNILAPDSFAGSGVFCVSVISVHTCCESCGEKMLKCDHWICLSQIYVWYVETKFAYIFPYHGR